MSDWHKPTEDRIFEGIAERFVRNVYGTRKGEVRLAILWRDLMAGLPQLADGPPLTVLDIGGGIGQLSCRLAGLGHQVTLAEPAAQMLELARAHWQAQGQVPVKTVQARLQALDNDLTPPADLVLCHAVLEWLVDPRAALAALVPRVRPGGWLSLTFYNRNAAIWSNLMRGNLEKVRANRLRGKRKRLTPISPLVADEVLAWGESEGLRLARYTGIRCFSDYGAEEADLEEVIATEWHLAHQDPFRQLARYIHLLYRAP